MVQIVKICGLSTQATLAAALDADADMVGFVFFPKSPRHVDLSIARDLARRAAGRAEVVALCVEPSDELLARIIDAIEPDYLQLHGAETPDRVAEIQDVFQTSVIKAIGVSTQDDFAKAAAYAGKCDALIIDAKAPPGSVLPGGNGVCFDWRLARDFQPRKPWLLSGGLTVENVAEAIALSRARGVDVSSGVETSPGVKDAAKIDAFIAAARAAFQQADAETPFDDQD